MEIDAESKPLLVFAVPQETGPFLRRARQRWGKPVDSKRICRGANGLEVTGWPVRILTTGMGAANAVSATAAALDAARAPWVMTCGFAGALDPELKLAAVVWDADADFSGTAWLMDSGAVRSRFLCETRVAVTAAEKAVLRKRTGADVVEMESGVIRALCREGGIPSATVRVISDTAGEDLPLDFNALTTPDLRLDPFKLALALIRSPGRIPELMRFQRSVQHAAHRLAEVLAGTPV